MAFDLAELVDSLKREINPPGQDLYPTTREDEWIGRLADAFWTARIHGMLKGWEVDDATMTVIPQSGSDDITRDLMQLCVLYAAYTITLTEMKNTQASFQAAAGPVQVEITKASNVLKGVLDAIENRIKIVLSRLSDAGSSSVEVFDAIIQHTENLRYGDEWWVR